jgi:hypothetical protein
MPAIKSMDRISSKWIRAAQNASEEYREGVENPKKDWSAETQAANDAYKQGITRSIQEDRFKKGVARAGTSKWQRGAIEKGVARWPQGIAVSQAAYEEGFKPYADVIARTQLPKRGPKGDPANINRVAAMSKALHDEKIKRT